MSDLCLKAPSTVIASSTWLRTLAWWLRALTRHLSTYNLLLLLLLLLLVSSVMWLLKFSMLNSARWCCIVPGQPQQCHYFYSHSLLLLLFLMVVTSATSYLDLTLTVNNSQLQSKQLRFILPSRKSNNWKHVMVGFIERGSQLMVSADRPGTWRRVCPRLEDKYLAIT